MAQRTQQQQHQQGSGSHTRRQVGSGGNTVFQNDVAMSNRQAPARTSNAAQSGYDNVFQNDTRMQQHQQHGGNSPHRANVARSGYNNVFQNDVSIADQRVSNVAYEPQGVNSPWNAESVRLPACLSYPRPVWRLGGLVAWRAARTRIAVSTVLM